MLPFRRSSSALLLLVVGCVSGRAPEATGDWWDDGKDLGVVEPLSWTDTPYSFPVDPDPGVADLPQAPDYTTWFAQEDAPPRGCEDWATHPELPIEIEGMVTAHPRIYFKVDGCVPAFSDSEYNIDSDEKYYGSFFIEDRTGGIFVLGDSKVAHFDMGDRVRLRVRAVKNNFDLPMVAAHDVLTIERGSQPMYFQSSDVDFSAFEDSTPEPDPTRLGRVIRIEGTVSSDPDTFGEFRVTGEEGQSWAVGLDVELNRRGVSWPVGTQVQITAPVLFSYGIHTLVVTRVGQVDVIDF